MGQNTKTTWIDEPSLVMDDIAKGLVSRIVVDAPIQNSLEDNSLDDAIRVDSDDVYDEPLSLFDRLSSQLTSSYRNLEDKVTQLKSDLSDEEIHGKVQLEEKEKLSNHLSTLLEILPAGVVLLDENGLITQSNPAAIDLLGEPLEGLPWLDVITRCFSPKHDDGHEVSLKDGRRVRIETRSMSAGSGQLILLNDLTETRLLQEKVSRTERLSSLGKMLASLAHQIRTPLSTAMLYAGHLCQREVTHEDRYNLANRLMSRLTHLEHQIRDMLVFARGDTHFAERLSSFDFFDALRQAAEPILEKSGVHYQWKCEDLDKAIMCNKDSLVGACVNLVNNSIEAGQLKSANDKPLLVQITLSTQNSSRLKLVIKDNGPGIEAANKDKVFEPFFTTKAQGTGLGLAVVQSVVTAHNGKFTINSSQNEGVSAEIVLPTCELTCTDQIPESAQQHNNHSETVQPVSKG